MDLFKEILDTKTSSSSPRFRMQMADLATAVVKENWDKEHPGCVKVEYILGADGAKTSDWIRVLPKSKLGIDIEHGFQPDYVEIKGKEDLVQTLKKKGKKSSL